MVLDHLVVVWAHWGRGSIANTLKKLKGRREKLNG
jgi:hypothetical protein